MEMGLVFKDVFPPCLAFPSPRTGDDPQVDGGLKHPRLIEGSGQLEGVMHG